ncbi:MAG: cupin domain-containing protein [Verrucomicrobia bacterium]|nr:cupin domain-containing protein [Verrucomicrobiota bacterium]
MSSPSDPHEVVTRAGGEPTLRLPGVELCKLAVGRCGTDGFSAGIATFAPGAALPCHTHTFSEIITALEGECRFIVEGRAYRLRPFDTMHVPRDVPHHGTNGSDAAPLTVHWVYSTTTPALTRCELVFPHRDCDAPSPGDPERLTRFAVSPVYEPVTGARFRDLFGRRQGCPHLCGGYGEFDPGVSLPCHMHPFDEAIAIIKGKAVCEVAGRRHALSGCDTALVPQGLPHRFLNESSGPMAMIWVYAGDEPERALVDPGCCTGALS